MICLSPCGNVVNDLSLLFTKALRSGLNLFRFIFMSVKRANQMFNAVQTFVTAQCFGKNRNAVSYFQQWGLSLWHILALRSPTAGWSPYAKRCIVFLANSYCHCHHIKLEWKKQPYYRWMLWEMTPFLHCICGLTHYFTVTIAWANIFRSLRNNLPDRELVSRRLWANLSSFHHLCVNKTYNNSPGIQLSFRSNNDHSALISSYI